MARPGLEPGTPRFSVVCSSDRISPICRDLSRIWLSRERPDFPALCGHFSDEKAPRRGPWAFSWRWTTCTLLASPWWRMLTCPRSSAVGGFWLPRRAGEGPRRSSRCRLRDWPRLSVEPRSAEPKVRGSNPLGRAPRLGRSSALAGSSFLRRATRVRRSEACERFWPTFWRVSGESLARCWMRSHGAAVRPTTRVVRPGPASGSWRRRRSSASCPVST
jgi:hypothetical protein